MPKCLMSQLFVMACLPVEAAAGPNLAVVPSRSGMRTSLLAGFNTRR
jgi:hypothetical protein